MTRSSLPVPPSAVAFVLQVIANRANTLAGRPPAELAGYTAGSLAGLQEIAAKLAMMLDSADLWALVAAERTPKDTP